MEKKLKRIECFVNEGTFERKVIYIERYEERKLAEMNSNYSTRV
jgi:hypothetical protein